jgi:hypothetical protein
MFLKTDINKNILLDDSFFQNQKYILKNIDYLNNILLNIDNFEHIINNLDLSINNEIKNFFINIKSLDIIESKLMIINLASILSEKFHSFFHFEQAYYHFLYADFLTSIYNKQTIFSKEIILDKIINNFEASIKQFRFNKLVHYKFIEFLKKNNDIDNSDKIDFCLKRFESLFFKKYSEMENGEINLFKKRQFEYFTDYIKFALSINDCDLNDLKDIIENKFSEKNFYSCFEKFITYKKLFESNNLNEAIIDYQQIIKIAENAISLISLFHQNYHKNSAKIYYNYSIIYKLLNQDLKSNNMIIKVKNLDPELFEKISKSI